ncbi:DUF4148 domain-containing protein [Paraburkholderia jirisanensis]
MIPHSRKPRGASAALIAAVCTALGVAAAAAGSAAQAQQPNPASQGSTTTRAAQKAEVKKLEQNGYQPGTDDQHYPQNLQNAEKKAHANAAAGKPAPAP